MQEPIIIETIPANPNSMTDKISFWFVERFIVTPLFYHKMKSTLYETTVIIIPKNIPWNNNINFSIRLNSLCLSASLQILQLIISSNLTLPFKSYPHNP